MGLSRDLDKARAASRAKDREASHAAHQSREAYRSARGQYLKSAVYGGLDGIITTFAVVAGAAGAALSRGVVLILGFANLIADGLSMAIGDYLSTKSEQEYRRAERRREQWEIENYPDGERRQMVELYMAKGISEAEARTIVAIDARHPEAWWDVMMIEELGISSSQESPLNNAVATFFSFAVFGLVPLLAYVAVHLLPWLGINRFAVASVSTAATLFLLGVLKNRVTGRPWIRSGAETLAVGGLAAAAAYVVGVLLGGLA